MRLFPSPKPPPRGGSEPRFEGGGPERRWGRQGLPDSPTWSPNLPTRLRHCSGSPGRAPDTPQCLSATTREGPTGPSLKPKLTPKRTQEGSQMEKRETAKIIEKTIVFQCFFGFRAVMELAHSRPETVPGRVSLGMQGRSRFKRFPFPFGRAHRAPWEPKRSPKREPKRSP